MATFSSWSALYDQLLDELASGNFRIGSHELNTGTTVRKITYQSFAELREQIEFVKFMRDSELGNWSPRTKTGNVRA